MGLHRIKTMGTALLVSFFVSMWVLLSGFVYCQRPAVVNVGAVFTYDSVIGRDAKVAMEAAVADINADQSILNGTRLNLIMADAQCNVFLGSIGAFQVLEKEAVAIIGPQSSTIAHMISFIANGLQVPLISYASTDPSLSALQFPFFVRSTQSDAYQMTAMADLIGYYGWREVIAIFADDEYGRSGISSLDNELTKQMSKISYKLAWPTGSNLSYITDLLNKTKLIGTRVFVVHANPDSGIAIFSVAQDLQMMTNGYVWIATDWLCATLDSSPLMNQTSLQNLQGVVGLCQHTPQSLRKKAFVSRWKHMFQKGLVSYGLNTYGLYAYDTVWAVARSIDDFLNDYGNITFSFNKALRGMQTSSLKLGKLRTFDGGTLLRSKLLQMNFTGLTGPVRFDSDRNLIGAGYDIINIDEKTIRRIGYWSNYSGLSVVPPETLKRGQRHGSLLDQKLKNVTWPGKRTEKPRGWVIGDNGRPLRIGVPYRASFVEFVTEIHGTKDFQGYCIDVFTAARELVPYDIPYKFVAFGDGKSNPSYDEFVRMVAENVIDGAVGDITIVTNRMKITDFTQPYAATGLVIVAPISNGKSSAWVFLKPFTVDMWCVTASFFILIGVVIWILEHRINDDFRGPPRRQLITMFLFSFSTLFKTNKEQTLSALGRMVMMVWLFLLMVITSSYTANLTSILTIQKLTSPITGLDSLTTSRWPIGYQVGSFARSYMIDNFNIPESRLVSLGSPEDYERALRLGPGNGGVAAIVDELPYVELFLSNRTDFGIVGEMFTKNGWGFAFPRDSPLAIDMSTAILRLSENGELHKIHKKWFCQMGCTEGQGHQSKSNQLHMISFWGLFLLCGIVTIIALLVFLARMVRQFVQYKRKQRDLSSASSSESSSAHCSQIIYNFFDFIDEKEEATKKMFKQCDNPQPQAS